MFVKQPWLHQVCKKPGKLWALSKSGWAGCYIYELYELYKQEGVNAVPRAGGYRLLKLTSNRPGEHIGL